MNFLWIPYARPELVRVSRLINLVAEDNAIEDTLYHLHRALNAGRIDLDKFLRVRNLCQLVIILKVASDNQGLGRGAVHETGVGRKDRIIHSNGCVEVAQVIFYRVHVTVVNYNFYIANFM